ncbi:MAG: hypothetical protein GXO88_13775 [Chlorobi bacterium]|nr:hypothetical protein [Chlorobiota bacterium]
MEKRNTKSTILSGTLIAGALLTFSVNADARPSTQVLGSGADVRTEIIELNANSSSDKLFELKCGEKSATAKKAGTKTKDAKAAEAKCGEGKCGSDDKKAAAVKKDSKTNAKAAEAKCGEGKCGSDTKKDTKASASKKAKTSEAKCGEGKCGAE